jgi:hypothetical protein
MSNVCIVHHNQALAQNAQTKEKFECLIESDLEFRTQEESLMKCFEKCFSLIKCLYL